MRRPLASGAHGRDTRAAAALPSRRCPHLGFLHCFHLLACAAAAELHLLQRVQLAILGAARQEHSADCGRVQAAMLAQVTRKEAEAVDMPVSDSHVPRPSSFRMVKSDSWLRGGAAPAAAAEAGYAIAAAATEGERMGRRRCRGASKSF